ncbi:UDP-2,4-diacetamido-2,4,6-trideoxy-beta-L-altropyranose hydrolase [Jannaschia sp. W003]|uniref:UDP-2,4-diacetamido-2,4, 6-trideoxy-beta-L-altropyranose hydrolase n=1 Tax=Jannaschia sp. W003 TaxID=2867012 RepID=UPI0021A442BE|nr:UDP-2,4-diacetamido-2,4,6-trideoxy-beta-L-altropyranose hydrolase [Jannaschia sp. W003]UWQ22018.1 UDP-2,4-diacetamido-2,4,6-trideoxy-beta-L-altropyranose hydrolase [Jannaschia sp. W003]
MRLLFRCDGDGRIGGGHIMRCLTLARAARERGWDVAFAMAEGGFSDRVEREFPVTPIPHAPRAPDPEAPPHGDWLSAPWERDAEVTAKAAEGADWLVWDHYGLDARWVRAVGAHRAMAFDDLDDRALASDVVLDLTRLEGRRTHHAPVELIGPAYAPLRPEFAAARAEALRWDVGPVRRVVVMPGLADAAGLAPLALRALDDFPALEAEVVMGAASQSREAAEAVLGRHRLVLDPPDVAQRMAAADLCIGASGMTNWERCALGLPTVAVAVAANQYPGLKGLARAGAVVPLTMDEARDPLMLRNAIRSAIAQAPGLRRRAAAICDGEGAGRVLDALDYRFRPVEVSDADRLMRWRGTPRIRAASHDDAPLDPARHAAWVAHAATRRDGIWTIYEEGGHPLGHASARRTDGGWLWSFYLGEPAPPGTGTRMCRRFLARLRAEGSGTVAGEVKAENAASIALHRRLGFHEAEGREGVLVFERALEDTAPEEERA